MDNERKFTPSVALALAIVLAYLVGIALMLAGRFETGVVLWGISTIVGGVYLFLKKSRERRAENEETLGRAVADAQKHMKTGEDDADADAP